MIILKYYIEYSVAVFVLLSIWYWWFNKKKRNVILINLKNNYMDAKIFRFKLNDWQKAFILFCLSTIANIIYTVLQSGDVFSYKTVILPFILAVLPYLIKNFTTNSNDQFLKAEPKTEAPKNETPA